MRAMSISASGIQASQSRQDLTAHNTANLQTPRYKALRANQAEQPAGGVATAPPTRLEAPGPILEGVEGSNVDLANEMAQSNVNLRSLQANAKVFKADDDMFQSVLDMKA